MTILEQFSEENIRKEIIEKIEKKWGTEHPIKLAMLKVTDDYNDENQNYSSNLILIDKDYNEVVHRITISTPSDDDEYQHAEETGEYYLPFNDVTVKFSNG